MKEKLGFNPWWKMWIRPRETIRQIVKTNPNYRLVWLSLVYALPSLFYLAQKLSWGVNLNFWLILLICVALAIPVGFIGFCINSFLIMLTGKLVKGKGTFKEIRAAFAWSSVPNTVNIALWLILIITFGSHVFLANFPTMLYSSVHGAILQLALILQLAVAIWMFVIFLHALGEVQGFSAWMAFLNVILGIIVWVVFIYLLTWVLGLVIGGGS
ncbi:MAG: YIP1 family protein [Chlamydiia bacterium]|nr:YIP1 family protein [Chlamydiia bacterium]